MTSTSATPAAPPASSPALVERRRVVRACAGVLDVLGVADGRLPVLRASGEDDVAGVARHENILFEIDDVLPNGWFRQRFTDLAARRGEHEISTDALCDYACFFARRAATLPRIDRIEFIVTRLLTRELDDGQLEALPQAEAFAVLTRLDLGVTADSAQRDDAVAFFLDAARRLSACTSVESVLSAGLYGEVQAHKRALHQQRLDPAILFASVLLSAAITNHLLRFAGAEGIARRTLLSRVASTDVDVDRILAARDDVVLVPRPRRYRLIFTDGTRRRAPLVFLALAAAAVVFSGPAEVNELSTVPPRLTVALSPLLRSAEVSNGSSPRVLFAQIDVDAWAALGPAERRARATELAAALDTQGIRAALVYDNGSLVVQVENGVVVLAR
jgi:hypothetical protein